MYAMIKMKMVKANAKDNIKSRQKSYLGNRIVYHCLTLGVR